MHLAPFGRAFVSLFLLHRDFVIPKLRCRKAEHRVAKISMQQKETYKSPPEGR